MTFGGDSASGADIQAALKSVSKISTVPQVFIGGAPRSQHALPGNAITGKFVGGCDATHALHAKGGLLPLLQ